MLTNIQDYFTFEIIYLWTTIGIIPFWLILILAPNSKINQILINSIILPLILSFAYGYIVYQIILIENPIFNIFNLYLSLDNLYTIFADESFLLIFWLHFLSLNIFVGSWISRDGVKYNIPRKWVAVPLLLVYFSGPVGLILYWLVRIFYSKKLGFHD